MYANSSLRREWRFTPSSPRVAQALVVVERDAAWLISPLIRQRLAISKTVSMLPALSNTECYIRAIRHDSKIILVVYKWTRRPD